ncbi:MAG TPA: ATP-binding protein [Sulfolobales archaeon]|nr:ATP-binding protein [Sulfolobales archaeon]
MEIPFVGRLRELESIRDRSKLQQVKPHFIYGPEGCGKTRLFIEAVRRFSEWFDDGLAVYVNAEEARDPRRIFYIAVGRGVRVSRGVRDLVASAIRAALDYLGVPEASLSGSAVALAITPILERFYLKLKLSGVQRILLVIDEPARYIEVKELNGYAKTLYNKMSFRWEGEAFYGRILNIYALTSEGLSRDLLSRHSYVGQDFVWNLSREEYEELYHRLLEIYRPENPSRIAGFDEVWRLYGGNPRRLMELAIEHSWDVKTHLERIYDEKKIPRIVYVAKKEGLLDKLRAVTEDPDNIYKMHGMLELINILVRENLVIEMPSGRGIGGVEIPRDRGLGIGRYWAWQVPVYRELVARALEEI